MIYCSVFYSSETPYGNIMSLCLFVKDVRKIWDYEDFSPKTTETPKKKEYLPKNDILLDF